MILTQTESGKAFEYQIALELSKLLEVSLLSNKSKEIAEHSFLLHTPKEQSNMQQAAKEVAVFLWSHDNRFEQGTSVYIQSDLAGREGDVRDIVVVLPNDKTIGISAKHRHHAIKHSRVSDKIDFGKEWANFPVSSEYKKRITPIFEDLREKQKANMLFKDIKDKNTRYYLPILTAFEDELKLLCENHGQKFVKSVFCYLLGKYDFYKIIKENGTVSIHSFNLNGSLKWGKKWKIPDRIESIIRKRGSTNTLLVSFVGGWQISFRIHNASSRVEPSFKFDINFIGISTSVAHHEINYLNPTLMS